MALRRVHIRKIAEVVAKRLSGLKAFKVAEEDVVLKVAVIITENMEAEHRLEDEAYKLLDKHRKATGGEIDEQKALLMIKKQLAKQKNFVL